ncbi:MAG TPA: hypothetical protein VGW80_10795 [Solirubrobacterales bacterium]|jgi:hypothetical protein|nr:hypothetical protein [Solirubrobacterales bacterium]
MDIDKLTTGEKIAGIAAVALFISMFFAWFGFDNPGEALESAAASPSTPGSRSISSTWSSSSPR